MAKVLLLADHTANKTHVCAICLENDWNQHQDNMKERSAAVETDAEAEAEVAAEVEAEGVAEADGGDDDEDEEETEYLLGDELF